MKTDRLRKGIKAFEACLVVALIGVFLGCAIVYHGGVLKRAKEVGLRIELRSMRASISAFEARHKHHPGSLEELLDEFLGRVRMGAGGRSGKVVQAAAKAAIDPFGNHYVYDPDLSEVRSQTSGYEGQ